MEKENTLHNSMETTTDPESIRRWIEQRDLAVGWVAEPTAEAPSSLTIISDDTDTDSIKRLTWEEFFELFERNNLAFVYETDGESSDNREACRFVDRDTTSADTTSSNIEDKSGPSPNEQPVEIADLAIGPGEITEDSMLEMGEIAVSEDLDDGPIQKEIVVTKQIQSRIINSEIVDHQLVDSTVTDREIARCEIIDGETIETEVIEKRKLTTEVFVEHTIAHEILNTDTAEQEQRNDTATVEPAEDERPDGSSAEPTHEMETHNPISESETIRRTVTENNPSEGDIFKSTVVEQRLLEQVVSDRIRARSTIDSAERIESDLIESTVCDRHWKSKSPIDPAENE